MAYPNIVGVCMDRNSLGLLRLGTSLATTPEDGIYFPVLDGVHPFDASIDITPVPFAPSVFDSSYEFDASDEDHRSPFACITHVLCRLRRLLEGTFFHRESEYSHARALQDTHLDRDEERRAGRESAAVALERHVGVVRRVNGDEAESPPTYRVLADTDEEVLGIWYGGEMLLGIELPPAYEHPPGYESLFTYDGPSADECLPADEEPSRFEKGSIGEEAFTPDEPQIPSEVQVLVEMMALGATREGEVDTQQEDTLVREDEATRTIVESSAKHHIAGPSVEHCIDEPSIERCIAEPSVAHNHEPRYRPFLTDEVLVEVFGRM
jgi:hypothetical protein